MCAYDEDLPPFDSAQRSLRKNTMLNILTEPVIRLDLSGGVRKDANLPEVFAALVSDKVVSFPALRPHQRHAWHAFLVQLGAMAMHRAGGADLPDIADEWAKLIRGLTPDFPEDEPWQLVVEDITKPAFRVTQTSPNPRWRGVCTSHPNCSASRDAGCGFVIINSRFPSIYFRSRSNSSQFIFNINIRLLLLLRSFHTA